MRSAAASNGNLEGEETAVTRRPVDRQQQQLGCCHDVSRDFCTFDAELPFKTTCYEPTRIDQLIESGSVYLPFLGS